VTHTRKLIWLCLLLTPLLLGAYALVEPYWLRVRQVTIADADVPAGFDGLRIAFLADIHCGPYFSPERVADVVELTNSLRPDLILLGGDYVHAGPQYIAKCFAELEELHAPLGVYGVLGNHDHWQGPWTVRREMDRLGFGQLDNRALWIQRGTSRIKLGGVGDVWEDVQTPQPTVHDVGEGDFVILVSHNPDFAEELTTDLVDVMLSGHTHGGQVTLFGLWAPATCSRYGQKYRGGVVQADHTTVVVSNGIGTVGLPVRFFARPEVVLVTLRRR